MDGRDCRNQLRGGGCCRLPRLSLHLCPDGRRSLFADQTGAKCPASYSDRRDRRFSGFLRLSGPQNLKMGSAAIPWLAASVGGAASFLLQGKGWPYTAFALCLFAITAPLLQVGTKTLRAPVVIGGLATVVAIGLYLSSPAPISAAAGARPGICEAPAAADDYRSHRPRASARPPDRRSLGGQLLCAAAGRRRDAAREQLATKRR